MDALPSVFPAQPGSHCPVRLFSAASGVVETLRRNGYTAYFAGGFARDILVGRTLHDIDIATNAHPEVVTAIFPDSRGFGKSFGVIQVENDSCMFEVATFRRDREYRDGRRPEGVVFTTAAEDAQRRDFTVNGMFYDPVDGVIIDYVRGHEDITARVIRAIGSPTQRFREDYLRMMRAVRFASVLNFAIDTETFSAIAENAHHLSSISAERLREELIRMLMESEKPGDALDLLRDSGILAVILPEVRDLAGVEQPPEFHPEGDVYQHVRLMLNNMRDRSPKLIWAILLHDIAKPATFAVGNSRDGKPRIQFHGHAERGAEMAEGIMRRFRCSNEEIADVHIAILNHMKFASVPGMKDSTLRRWVGSETFPLELELHRIDCLSCHGKLDHFEFMREYMRRLSAEPVLPPAIVRGKDLIGMGIVPGPEMGSLLKLAYDAQLEGAFDDLEGGLQWVVERRGKSTDIHE